MRNAITPACTAVILPTLKKVLLYINCLIIFIFNYLDICFYFNSNFCLLPHKYMQISPVTGSSLLYTCSSHAHKTKKSRLTLNPGKTTARFSPVHFNSFLPVVVTQTKMHRALPSRTFTLFYDRIS